MRRHFRQANHAGVPIYSYVTSEPHSGAEPRQQDLSAASPLQDGLGTLPQGSLSLLDLRYRYGKTGEALARDAGIPEPVAYTILARIHRLLRRVSDGTGWKPPKSHFDPRGLPRPSSDGEDWLEALGLRALDDRTAPSEGAYLAALLCRDARRRDRYDRLVRLVRELGETIARDPGESLPAPPSAADAPSAFQAAPQTPLRTRRRAVLAASLGLAAFLGFGAWVAGVLSPRADREIESVAVGVLPQTATTEPLTAPSTPVAAPVPDARQILTRLAWVYLTGGRCGTGTLGRF